MLIEPGVVDANIFVYAINPDSPQHAPAQALLDAARDPSVTLYVTSQILCEFYSVITNRKRVAVPTSPADALEIISDLLALPGLHVLPAPAQTVTRLLKLLQRRAVTGSEVFDLQIVATMQANDVQRIYTFNTGDFEIFPELTVAAPQS
jgi:toxin-antitoxin system PIN domain toxin